MRADDVRRIPVHAIAVTALPALRPPRPPWAVRCAAPCAPAGFAGVPAGAPERQRIRWSAGRTRSRSTCRRTLRRLRWPPRPCTPAGPCAGPPTGPPCGRPAFRRRRRRRGPACLRPDRPADARPHVEPHDPAVLRRGVDDVRIVGIVPRLESVAAIDDVPVARAHAEPAERCVRARRTRSCPACRRRRCRTASRCRSRRDRTA